ncbi:NSs [Termeil virus]|uniref:Non-structural protein NS-S n=1 Tax=Termeil virus TaxID=2748250 RepID=A0A7D9MVT4_9VIRU|nr:NSs [Termeil virus]QLA47016.1 NSs [Termeil virus]
MNLFTQMMPDNPRVGLIQSRGMLNLSITMGQRSLSLPLGCSFSMRQDVRLVSRIDLSDRCQLLLTSGSLLYSITIFLQTGTMSLAIMTSPSIGSPVTLLGLFITSTETHGLMTGS